MQHQNVISAVQEPATETSTPSKELIDELLTVAFETADKAAELILERLDTVIEVETKSSATDLVTEVDKAAEELIVANLITSRPDDGILGEEGAGVKGSSGISWIVDPIDGTTSFVYGQTGFSVSIAAYRDDVPLVGVVLAPALRQCFWAFDKGGAHICSTAALRDTDFDIDQITHRSKPLAVSRTTDIGRALIGTGLSYQRELREIQSNVLAKLVLDVGDIRRIGSAAIELCMVAAGQTDGYYEHDLSFWDYAAGILIAREAGADIGQSTNPVTQGAFLCVSTPKIFDDLRALIDFE